MGAPVTIREKILTALQIAGPNGLTMAAIAGTVTGPWRSSDVEATVRTLWQSNQVGRRQDGTYVATGAAGTTIERVSQEARRMQRAVRDVAERNRRSGFDSTVTTRVVDPALLTAWCPRCRATVRPRLDGTCATCATQTGANQEPAAKPRRRRRRKPLREGQPGFGTACRCGGPKTKQAHACRSCSAKRRRGRKVNRASTGDRRRGPRAMTEEQLLEARRLYATGLSLRQVAAQLHAQTEYKSVASCAEGLHSLFKTRGWKLRPQREVTIARNFKHGRKARARTPEQERAYRHWYASQQGWNAVQGPGRPICKGVRANSPGKGRPCEHHALADSEYCYSHDPRFELQRQAVTSRMRARATKQSMLPAGPFVAWLGELHAELGTWERVAAAVGGNASLVNKWGNGRQNGQPLEQISIRVVQRSAAAARTTIEVIYGQPHVLDTRTGGEQLICERRRGR